MSNDCRRCTCNSAATTASSGRLLLASQVGHTVRALESIALRRGLETQRLAPGLLALETDEIDALIADAYQELSSVEADEVRCVVLEGSAVLDLCAGLDGTAGLEGWPRSAASLVAEAMSAASLAAVKARRTHADLLPLFADEQRCFYSVYQPIITLGDQRTIGYEALLRAETPDGDAVMPDVLFPAAEAAGWLHLLDRVGRTTALRDAGPWIGDELLFINFIPTSIYRPEVCLRTTEAAAHRAGVRLDQLVFEVTEGHEVRDVDHLQRVFEYYRSHHCKVAIDDLGAGYSSLNLLVRLEPDVVKLDKELVQQLPGPTARAVVSATVDIVHAYGGLVLAECVETQAQANAALGLGVDLAQGWLFGRPTRRDAAGVAGPRSRPAPSPASVSPHRPDAAIAVVRTEPTNTAGAGSAGQVPTPTAPMRTVPAEVGADDPMQQLLVRAVEAAATGVVVVDMLAPDCPILFANPAFERLTGYRADETVGRNCRFLQGADTDLVALRTLAQALREGREHRVVLRNYRKDGRGWYNQLDLSPVYDDNSRLTHYLGFQQDVTERVEFEQLLIRRAAHDDLTGLANRTRLVQHLDVVLASAERNERAVAVLFIDLNGFKEVNDTLGHAAGDEILVQVAERTKAVIRGEDLLARTGGDEFVVVLADLDPLDGARIAQRASADVSAILRRPFTAGDTQMALTGSVGLSVFPDDALTSESLLAQADAAMYRAKGARERAGLGQKTV